MKRGTPDHPKAVDLAERLGIERWGAAGILECLWHFAAQYARRGDIGRRSDASIAKSIGWRGEPKVLIEALVAAGWLDRCPCHGLRIHDWPGHADQAVQRSGEVKAEGFLECYSLKLEDSSRRLEDSAMGRGSAGPAVAVASVPLPEPEPSAGPSPSAPLDPTAFAGNRRNQYAEAFFEAWRKRRGGGALVISPAEYALIDECLEADVPLRIALRGLADCAGKPGPKTSLVYAGPAVREAVARWRTGMSGAA